MSQLEENVSTQVHKESDYPSAPVLMIYCRGTILAAILFLGRGGGGEGGLIPVMYVVCTHVLCMNVLESVRSTFILVCLYPYTLV